MAIKEILLVELAKAAIVRSAELATDKTEFKVNAKAPSTGFGLAGLGGLAVMSPEIHASIGGLETLEQQVLHVVVGVVELAWGVVSVYLAAKKPSVSREL